MTPLTYLKDARTYRFSLPNEIWGLKLPPPAFSILTYLCYLNSHHKGDAVPSVDKIAELLHMSPDMAQKHLDALVKRDLISPQMVPVFTHKRTGKFFSLPNEIFFLDLGHGAITVYAYLLYCEDRSSHQCHPSYNTISTAVGLSVNTVMKHIAKLEERQFITAERTSYFDCQGMKKNGNNPHGFGSNLTVFTVTDPERISEKAEANWENSPGHLATMIDPNCDTVGVGVIIDHGRAFCYMFVGNPITHNPYA